MTQKPTQEDYDRLMEEFNRMLPIHAKLNIITADGIYEVDTNFFPARGRKIEPKEQEAKK